MSTMSEIIITIIIVTLPVPSGMIAIGGDWHSASWPTLSRHDNAQPTEPSPPHTRIRKYGMLRNTYKLQPQ